MDEGEVETVRDSSVGLQKENSEKELLREGNEGQGRFLHVLKLRDIIAYL